MRARLGWGEGQRAQALASLGPAALQAEGSQPPLTTGATLELVVVCPRPAVLGLLSQLAQARCHGEHPQGSHHGVGGCGGKVCGALGVLWAFGGSMGAAFPAASRQAS